MNENWIQHLKDYHEFLQWDDEEMPDYKNMTQDEARSRLQSDLEFIIGTNGYGELYETEQMYMKLLNMEEE
jgi:hypothetical protein